MLRTATNIALSQENNIKDTQSTSDTNPRQQLRTIAVHAGRQADDALVGPIHRSSTYRLGEPESFDDIRYTRL
ncbi:MAG: hypothetical protein ACI9KE_006350, partial [Polyangiales bacterium]